MSEARYFVMSHPMARERAIVAVGDAPAGWEITVKPPSRNNAQNALLHSLLGEIADCLEWAGKKRSIDTWKRLLTAAWLRAEGESIELLPAIDGHGVDFVWTPTSSLSKTQMASLIDYVSCFAAEQGIGEPTHEG